MPFLPAWYLLNGTIKAAENELENASSSCERWGIWCGALVVVAVVAELVIAWIEPPYATFLAESAIADAAIAIGIVGEVAFGMWDSRIQTELRRRSNKRLSEALDRASQAEEALAEFRRPRAVILRERGSSIKERIAAFAGTRFDAGISHSGEVAECWWYLQPLLTDAGWVQIPWQGASMGWPVTQGSRPPSGQVSATNIEIHIKPEERAEFEPAGKALVDALNELGITAIDVGCNTHSTNAKAIHIQVGEKQ